MSTFSLEEAAFETRQIHAGQVADPTTGARALPDIFMNFVDLAIREKDLYILYQDLRFMYHNNYHESFVQAVYESDDLSEFDPYCISSRLALITFALGEQLHFNCKTGLSQTGHLHDQILEFCEWRYQFGEYPRARKAHKEFNDHRKKIFSIIALNGCAQEIYKLNNGIPGSKADKSIVHGPNV